MSDAPSSQMTRQLPLVSTEELSLFNFAAISLFVAVYGVVVFLAIDYNIAWSQQEVNIWRGFVADHNIVEIRDYLINTFNWPVFEQAPRLSRPLASLLEIFDAQFKIWFANNLFPHPALSLTWLFSLVLSPILLYKGLRHYAISNSYSLLGTAFYIATPGFLSSVVMSFRVSKPMACFFLILIFYMISRYRALMRIESEDNSKRSLYVQYFYLLISATILISLFFDESAVFGIFFAFLLLFEAEVSHISLKKGFFLLKIVPLFLVICCLYILSVQHLMPFLASLAGFPVAEGYELQNKATPNLF